MSPKAGYASLTCCSATKAWPIICKILSIHPEQALNTGLLLIRNSTIFESCKPRPSGAFKAVFALLFDVRAARLRLAFKVDEIDLKLDNPLRNLSNFVRCVRWCWVALPSREWLEIPSMRLKANKIKIPQRFPIPSVGSSQVMVRLPRFHKYSQQFRRPDKLCSASVPLASSSSTEKETVPHSRALAKDASQGFGAPLARYSCKALALAQLADPEHVSECRTDFTFQGGPAWAMMQEGLLKVTTSLGRIALTDFDAAASYHQLLLGNLLPGWGSSPSQLQLLLQSLSRTS